MIPFRHSNVNSSSLEKKMEEKAKYFEKSLFQPESDQRVPTENGIKAQFFHYDFGDTCQQFPVSHT